VRKEKKKEGKRGKVKEREREGRGDKNNLI